ncbi:MAG TPA: sigma-70 family RNA polymerase sigma factor [Candidatus Eisenbacteria bacterium]|nr:sigma-70 family RNA polymerase sigma factor [Candidatus Eisenbacteria bacterium]
MAPDTPPSLHWPAALCLAVCELRAAPAGGRERPRSRLWPIVHAALYASLRAQAGRIAPVAAEDLEDLASQKALELMVRAEEGAWDPAGRAEHEVAGYVSRVARHALVDLARRRGRQAPAPENAAAWDAALATRCEDVARPEDVTAAREFAGALRECVCGLGARARRVWFARVYLERPSREIAAGLGLKPAHVDVLVQRARTALCQCMTGKGHRDAEARTGCFVELWRAFAEEFARDGDERDGGPHDERG